MKPGTLLKTSDVNGDKQIGVVYKVTDQRIFIYWSPQDYNEGIYLTDFNRWVSSGVITVMETS
tara:strand:- start:972 stop:1160 length:189 start_codon:yes stop_codon:yes gene_type:complete